MSDRLSSYAPIQSLGKELGVSPTKYTTDEAAFSSRDRALRMPSPSAPSDATVRTVVAGTHAVTEV